VLLQAPLYLSTSRCVIIIIIIKSSTNQAINRCHTTLRSLKSYFLNNISQ